MKGCKKGKKKQETPSVSHTQSHIHTQSEKHYTIKK